MYPEGIQEGYTVRDSTSPVIYMSKKTILVTVEDGKIDPLRSIINT